MNRTKDLGFEKVDGEGDMMKSCLICGRSHQDEDGKRDDQIQSSSSIVSSSVKLLTAYILRNSSISSSERDREREEIQSEILSSFKNGKCSICAECLSRAGNLLELHLELEKIQIQILDVLRNLQHYLKSSMVTGKRGNDDGGIITRFQDVLQREFLSRKLLDGTLVRLERLRCAGYKNISSFILVSHEETQNPEDVRNKTDERRLRRLKKKSNHSMIFGLVHVIPRDMNRFGFNGSKAHGTIADDDDEVDSGSGSCVGTDQVQDHNADNQSDDDKCDAVIPSDNDDDDDDDDDDHHSEDNGGSHSHTDTDHCDNDENDREEIDKLTKPKTKKRKLKGAHLDCDICLEVIPSKDMEFHLQTHPEFERFYECEICPPHRKKRIYGTYKGLVWHYLRLNHKIDLLCQLCPDSSILFSRSKLCRHLYEFHQLNHKKLPCLHENCQEEFYDRVTRRAHFHREHCGTFSCDDCQKTFKSKTRLNYHKKMMHSPDNQLQCPSCPKVFKSECGFRLHLKTHDEGYIPEMAKCPQCSKMIVKIRLKRHIQSHGEEGKGISFKCDSCSKEFKTYGGLLGHRKSHHEEPDMVMCSQCPKIFHRHHLHNHIRMVHGEKKKKKTTPEVRYPCQYCPKTFASPWIVKAHEESHRNERKYKCEEPECSYAANTKGALIQHRRTHIKEKTIKCRFCPKMFKTEIKLRDHECTAHGESEDVKALKCQYCQKTFSLPCFLKDHEDAHRNERKYQCPFPQCSYKASSRKNLNSHKNIHKGKTLQCQYCPMKFAIKKYLMNHESTHSKEKTFKCDMCSEGFKTWDSRFRHRKKVHGIVPVKPDLAGVGIINQK